MSFSFLLTIDKNLEIARSYDKISYDLGEALTYLNKEAATRSNVMSGRLYASTDGAILLDVPNSLIRGSFDALSETGLTLPGKNGKFNGHIVAMTTEEVRGLKGVDSITERGHRFNYNINSLQEAPLTNSLHHGKVWFFSVASQDLSKLRKSYGLSPTPGKHGFHIVVALRKLGVLGNNGISKQAWSDRVDARIDSEAERSKTAASYQATGNVQGVGLRATLHDLLNKGNMPGLAVNNPYTGNVDIDLPLEPTDSDDVITRLRNLLDSGEAGKDSYQINKVEKANKLFNIVMDKKNIDRFVNRQGFKPLGMETDDYKKQWLTDRYRLTNEGGNLTGKVAPMAYRQLRGLEPVYSEESYTSKGKAPPDTVWMRKARAKNKASTGDKQK